jgi:hypothetical protein
VHGILSTKHSKGCRAFEGHVDIGYEDLFSMIKASIEAYVHEVSG